jgi:hypothetical protein
LTVLVPVALKAAVDEWCQAKGETVSEAVQHALTLLLPVPAKAEES